MWGGVGVVVVELGGRSTRVGFYVVARGVSRGKVLGLYWLRVFGVLVGIDYKVRWVG